MIEFSEHAAFTGWNDTALYSEFYRGLAERIKNMLLHMERAITLNQLKIDALKCNNRFWEREHKKIPVPVSCAKAIPSTTTQPVKPALNPLGNNPNPDRKDLGNILGMDGKLTSDSIPQVCALGCMANLHTTLSVNVATLHSTLNSQSEVSFLIPLQA